MSARTGWFGNVLSGPKTAFGGSSAILALTIPIAAILGACLYVCYSILQSAAYHADAAELEAEERIAKAAILFTTAPAVKSNADYANWDEMFVRAKKPLDPKWADPVIGSYQENFASVTGSAVLTGSGDLRYLYLSSRSSMRNLTRQELSQLTSLTRNALAKPSAGRENPRSGFAMLRDKPVFLVMTPIKASGLEGGPKNEKPFASLIFFVDFNAEFLSGFTRNFNLANPHIVPVRNATIALPNFPGLSTNLGLEWKKRIASQGILGDSLPVLKALAAIALLLIGVVAGGWSWILTRVRKMEAAALTERTMAAEQAAQAKSLFIANMSHELRTPLNAIIGFSEMLTNQLFGSLGHRKYAEYAEDILASGRHLLTIVNDILLMSKLDAKKHEFKIGAVAIESVVKEAITLVSGDAMKRNVRIEFSNRGASPIIFADRQALKQVVINLLGNAVKFSAADRCVEVETCESADPAITELHVRDHGCGMPEELVKKLGQPFTQASHAYIRSNQGTGLGLSISFALAAGFGGGLRFESVENAGTTAILRLRSAKSMQSIPPTHLESRAA
ncbi:MAG TPA: ATP-binding protein [Rhizomicrobium sp.]